MIPVKNPASVADYGRPAPDEPRDAAAESDSMLDAILFLDNQRQKIDTLPTNEADGRKSVAQVERGAVVRMMVDVSLQEA